MVWLWEIVTPFIDPKRYGSVKNHHPWFMHWWMPGEDTPIRPDWPTLSAENNGLSTCITFSSRDTLTIKMYYLTVFKHFVSIFLLIFDPRMQSYIFLTPNFYKTLHTIGSNFLRCAEPGYQKFGECPMHVVIENGIVMSKSEWKKIVNDQVKDKENKEWTATSLLYRGLNDFKSTGINLKTGTAHFYGKLK